MTENGINQQGEARYKIFLNGTEDSTCLCFDSVCLYRWENMPDKDHLYIELNNGRSISLKCDSGGRALSAVANLLHKMGSDHYVHSQMNCMVDITDCVMQVGTIHSALTYTIK